MEFIKNNKLTFCLGALCFVVLCLYFINGESSSSSKKWVFTSIVPNTESGQVKESSIAVALRYDINPDTILVSGSKKLIQESGEDLKARLSLDDQEPDSIDIKQIAQDLGKNYTPKGYTEYEVAKGDTLTGIWLKNGDTRNASFNAATALKKSGISLSSLRIGEVLRLYIKAGKIQKLERKMPLGKEITLSLRDDGKYDVKVFTPKVIEKSRIVTGKIDSCFSIEAMRLGIPNDVIDQFVDLFSSKVSFRSSLRHGDVFSIKYIEKRTEKGEFLSAGNIQAASIINQGKFLPMIGYKGNGGKMNYYNETGEVAGNYMLRYPVSFTRVSSVFSDNRLHPILKKKRPHNGVDFAAPIGTPVRTVADGMVTFAGWNGGAGKMITVQHSSKYKTSYLHLSKITSDIKVGKRVSRGQQIGNVGTTGLSTGPHLHYSFYINNKYVDPLKIDLPSMPIGGGTIPKQYLNNAIAELRSNTNKVIASNESKEPNA